jgi:hypothetical protein
MFCWWECTPWLYTVFFTPVMIVGFVCTHTHTHTHTHTNQGYSSHGQDATEFWEANDLHKVAVHSYTFARDNPPQCMQSAQWARTRNVRISLLKKETESRKTYLDVRQLGYFTRKSESKRVGLLHNENTWTSESWTVAEGIAQWKYVDLIELDYRTMRKFGPK